MNKLKVELAITFALSVFYGVLFLFRSMYEMFRTGKKLFKVNKRKEPPRCLRDPSLGKHVYVELKEVKLHYVTNGNSQNPLMVLIHGFPDFWFSWRNQLKEFCKDYWVVAIDMRGYGESEKPEGIRAYQVSKIEDDIKQLLNALGRKSGVIVGHDWGGCVAWSLAAHYPEIVEQLIIMNAPHPRNFEETLHSNLHQFFKSWYIFFFQLPLVPELDFCAKDLAVFDKEFCSDGRSICSEEEIEAYKYYFSQPGAFTPPINFYRAAIGWLRKDLQEEYDGFRIKAPTLVIWGEKDKYLVPELATGCARYTDNYTLRIIENASHWVHLDHAEEVNKHMWSFLKKQRK
ncbi:epoxide hydrolase 4-like [Limulus polyphemus]|uniref:Epoxide hydrolase 4-like n=1 Tax=Limulus polyphemus TaxID=6850 RepID=A0ABM1B4B7_LIMPO|nr:epoxide hydrolase 4-like [Limulus polyphemus]